MCALKVLAPKQHVLVVEDDRRMLELLCDGLREAGHIPIAASDGGTALKLAMKFSFDSIILDVGLPIQDGRSVASCIRATKSIPILMLTARDSEDDILRGFDHGADASVSFCNRSRDDSYIPSDHELDACIVLLGYRPCSCPGLCTGASECG